MARTREKKTQTKDLAMAALFAALTFVATVALVIPSPSGGYLNLGDTVVLLGAYLLGPVYGAAAGGLGAALADLMAGYAMYVPATLLIKGGMGLLAGLLYRSLGKRTGALTAAGLAAEALMVGGYWLYDGFLLGSLAGAAAGVPGNLMQGVLGIAASTALTVSLKKIGYVRQKFPKL